MDPVLLYVIIGAVVALLVIGVGIAVGVSSRKRALERRRRDELGAGPSGGGAAGGGAGTGTLEHPDLGAGGGVAVEERLERPEAPRTRLRRLRERLAGQNNLLARGLLNLLSGGAVDEDTWDDFEATLISSDLGVGPTTELVDRLRTRYKVEGVTDPQQARSILREELLTLVDPTMDRSLNTTRRGENPAMVLVVGVNGTGKTTTVGKLARVLVAEDQDVLLGAADTFRAAAADQLETWGTKVGVPTIRG
ncbi:MAG: signal recognition particle receptor subunit alpha, partial [Propionibacteriaceae bacterium]|nr:signal recognition particle receptor subunit alpha [Propionibacteriaceae bacterium]